MEFYDIHEPCLLPVTSLLNIAIMMEWEPDLFFFFLDEDAHRRSAHTNTVYGYIVLRRMTLLYGHFLSMHIYPSAFFFFFFYGLLETTVNETVDAYWETVDTP